MERYQKVKRNTSEGDHTTGPVFWEAPDIAKADLPVFPVKNKEPTVKGGFYAATTDLSQIAAWIEEGREDHDPAVPTGVFSGVVVIEADTPKAVEEMRAKYGEPTALSQKGAHWYFRHPKNGKVVSNNVREGLDRKGDGGYVVVPPGKGRQWTNGIPRLEDLPVLPEEFWTKQTEASDAPRALPTEKKNAAAAAIASRGARIEKGKRHEHLRHVSGVLLSRDVPLGDAEDILVGAWTQVGGELAERAPKEVPNTLRTTEKAIAAGRATGVPKMEEITPGLYGELETIFGWKDPVFGESPNGYKGKRPEAPTHDELRDRWLEDNPDYAFGLGEWRRYEDGVWAVAKQLTVEASIMRVLEEAKAEGTRPNGFVLSSVHKLARVEAYIADEVWDGNPSIIVATNGAIDIESGDLLTHSPKHYSTSRVPYAYSPDAKAANWARFIGDIDKDVAAFLQEFAGYCLTTWTHFEKALWMVGPPGGGKSTFLEGLIAMLGERAGVLGLAEIERSPFALAKLVGKTLVTAAEQPAGFITRYHIINAIISGELIQIERKYRDPYDIIPRAKIAWAMNEPPRIPSGAEGLFRRVEVIRFPAIDEADRNPGVKEGIKEEGAGVLNWALEGLERLRKRGGFAVPEKVEQDTEEFRQSNDIPGLFVAEKCIRDPEASEKASELYKEYKYWCEENGHRWQSSTRVAEDWQRLGFERYRSMGTTRYRSVRLRSPGEE